MEFLRLYIFASLILPQLLLTFALADGTPPATGWTMETAVQYALRNNPDSKIAETRIAIAKAQFDQASSSQLPQVILGSSYDQTNNPMYSFGNILNQGAFDSTIDFNNPGRTDSLKAIAEIRYRLYSGGKNRAEILSSEHFQQSQEAKKEAVLNQLSYEVVRTFQLIKQMEEMVAARQSELAAITASLKIAEARYNVGDLLRQELLNLEVQQARASENLIQARHALSLANHAFNRLLGIKEGDVILAKEPSTEQVIPKSLSFSDHPKIKMLEASIASAQSRLKASESDLLPKIDGYAKYQYDHGFVYDESGDSWMAGITLSYSLFDGGLVDAKTSEQHAIITELEENKRKVELQLNYELQKANQDLQQADEKVTVTNKMIQLAQESARLSRARFKEGVVLTSDLIDAETRLTDALMRNAQAKAQYRTAIAYQRMVVGLGQF